MIPVPPPPEGPPNPSRRLLFFALRVCVVAGLGALAFFLGLRLHDDEAPEFPPRALVVSVVDVGHGEASWIRTPDGRFIVIGAGPPGSGAAVAASLRSAGARRIDLLVLPYPYADCLGAAPELLAQLPAVEAIESGWTRVNRKQEETREALRARGTPVSVGRDGDRRQVGAVGVEVLAPGRELVARTPAAGNNSLVVRVRYGGVAFLWAGGIEGPGEAALLARGPDRLRSDWLRVARFGNAGASSAEFLEAVGARFAVVATGPNKAGLPAPETLERLSATGAQVLRTDQSRRDLVFLSDGDTVWRAR